MKFPHFDICPSKYTVGKAEKRFCFWPSKHKNRRKNPFIALSQGGFTLIELMVAIAVFTILITALFPGFRSFFLSGEQIRNHIQKMDTFQDAEKRIRLDLFQLYMQPMESYTPPAFSNEYPFGFRSVLELLGGREFSYLVFTSSAHALLGSQPRPGVARISYYVRQNPRGGYDLFRSDVLSPFAGKERSCQDPMLMAHVSRFRAVFVDANGKEHDTWNSDSQEFGYSFPRVIRFVLATLDPRTKGENTFEFSVLLSVSREEDRP